MVRGRNLIDGRMVGTGIAGTYASGCDFSAVRSVLLTLYHLSPLLVCKHRRRSALRLERDLSPLAHPYGGLTGAYETEQECVRLVEA